MAKTLVVPAAAQRDPIAMEMARVWIAERGLHCALHVGMYAGQGHDEPRAWGIILADMARHVSNALAEEFGDVTPEDALASVRDAMLAELDDPSTKHSGSFVSDEHIED